MTAIELIKFFNQEFSKETPWPESYEVDAETYANVCQFIFSKVVKEEEELLADWGEFYTIRISVGKKNSGIMFKNVELILATNKTT